MKTKLITLDGHDRLQIFACRQALEAAQTGLFLAHPKAIRSTAQKWLNMIGIETKPRESWKSLETKFVSAFSEVIDHD